MIQPEIVVVPVVFATIGYITWVLVTAWQRRYKIRAMTEFHGRLLDKLGSVKDFGEFLQTEAGARLVADLGSDTAPASGAHDRILRALQLGAVLACLGAGLLLMTFFSPTLDTDAQHVFNAFGVIALSLGVGFLISAAASYRLAGNMGLLERSSLQRRAAVPSQS